MPPIRTILVPTDFSPPAAEAFRQAHALARGAEGPRVESPRVESPRPEVIFESWRTRPASPERHD